MNKVTVLGSGVLGAQIALVTSVRGFEVAAWDINDEACASAAKRFDTFGAQMVRELDDVSADDLAAGRARLTQTTDIEAAAANADLIIEAVPENLEIKRDVWSKAGAAAGEHTILATNTSTLLPSEFADATGHPERFLALHFANHIWLNNTAEIMPHAGTDPKYVDILERFATDIKMLPVKLQKEQPGYVLNTLLVPFLNAAQYLLANGVASPEDVDKNWRNSTGAPMGPFEIMDMVGLRTVHAVGSLKPNPSASESAFHKILEEMIAEGRIGKESGQGFFAYDEEGNRVSR
ncbi:3-hydroxyacyl-CoA dehydrogenase [Corynebacterium sanguinis]|nr:3-hydroxyacyl-CoA dehydrogenase [Corynebacterium sanguinis]